MVGGGVLWDGTRHLPSSPAPPSTSKPSSDGRPHLITADGLTFARGAAAAGGGAPGVHACCIQSEGEQGGRLRGKADGVRAAFQLLAMQTEREGPRWRGASAAVFAN